MNDYKFTLRERLADWISGGALSDYIGQAVAAKLGAVKAAQATMQTPNDFIRRLEVSYTKRSRALTVILAATENGKSGTAQKVARIAREALK